MVKLTEKYSNLGDMIVTEATEESEFRKRCEAAGVSPDQLTNLTTTLRNIDRNKAEVPAMPEFKRIHVGKLTVPVSFLRHIELLAKFAGVSEEAVWQLLMIETCQMYADRYSSLIEMLNDAVVKGRA